MVALAAIEEGANFPDWAIERLNDRLRNKIDAYRFKHDELKAIAKIHRGYAREQDAKAKALENEAEGMKKRLVYYMEKMGFDALPGEQVKATLSKPSETYASKKIASPTISMAYKYREFIRTKREWDWPAIKAAAKEGDDLALGLCEKTVTRSFSFKANKGATK